MSDAIGGRKPFEVLRGARNDSCYRFTVRNTKTGAASPAYLTNELFPSPTPDRGLLLCGDVSIIPTRRERAFYTELAGMLRANRHERTGVAKSIVNDFVEGRESLEGVRIAVHKFGPVPVLVLDEPVALEVHGRNVEARVAMFPRHERTNTGPGGQGRLLPFFTSSRVEFRQSMTVAPHLVFQRYFEDVVEDFHDMRRTVKPWDLYRRAKTAEVRLAESVRGKLEILVPKERLASDNKEPFKREAWDVFQKIAGTLFEASVARSIALLLLNDVYQLIGIASRTAHYRAMLDDHRHHFGLLLGPTLTRLLTQNSQTLQYLFDLVRRYESANLLRHEFVVAGDLIESAKDAPLPWCGELAKFAAFALMGRKLAGPRDAARIFISHHHDVAVSELVRRQVSEHLADLKPRSVIPLAVTDLPEGSPARHVVRSAIWLAHGTIAICPAETRSIRTRQDKDYKWIAREGEYSLLLKKRVLFGTEQGTDLNAVLTDLKNSQVGYLVRGSKLPTDETRADDLAKHFQDRVRTEFRLPESSSSATQMEMDLKEDVSDFANEVRVRHAELLLDGYVNQFDPETHRLLVFVLAFLGPLGKSSRSAIVGRIALELKDGDHAKAQTAFTNMWRQVRDRRLLLGRRGVGILELPDKTRYTERLTTVIRVLLPELQLADRKAWRKRWLDRQSAEVGLRLRGR